MDTTLDFIFIDTSVLQQEQFFKETSRVSKLLRLAKNGYIRILLPIITEQEWLKHFKEQAELNIKINEVKRKLELLGKNEASSIFLSKYEDLVKSYNSQKEIERLFYEKIAHKGIIRIDYPFLRDTTADVFNKYFNKEKPFGTGGKAKEFPDAFVLAALEKYAKENKLNKVICFSQDKDMLEYKCDLLDFLSINEYLNFLLEEKIPNIDKKTKQKEDINKLFNYINAANPEFESALKTRIEQYLLDADFYSYVDIEEVSVPDFILYITAENMDILSVSNETIEAVCFPKIDGTVQVKYFSEEDSIWDSEEKEWFYKSYKTTQIGISSYIPVVVKMQRNELDMGQDPGVEIVDIDFRSLQASLDDELY